MRHELYIIINKSCFPWHFSWHSQLQLSDTGQEQMIRIRVLPYSLVASLISLAFSKHPDNDSCAWLSIKPLIDFYMYKYALDLTRFEK